jgi:hypothetical protein
MGDRGTVEVGAMAVEPPAKGRITLKMLRVGTLNKGKPQTGIGRIGLPEPLIAAKVRQPRIHPHAGAGGNNQRLRSTHKLSRNCEHTSLHKTVSIDGSTVLVYKNKPSCATLAQMVEQLIRNQRKRGAAAEKIV